MRNRYSGTCYRCGKTVEPGDGHFERTGRSWRTIHTFCVAEQRAEKSRLAEEAARASQEMKHVG